MTAPLSDSDRWQQGREIGVIFQISPARISLTGNDRVRYLNGQCTNDVRTLTPQSHPIQACILSARGKLDAVVWIWAEPDRLVVECEADLADAVTARLEKYIVADDVTVELLPAPIHEWHVIPGSTPLPSPITNRAVRQISRLGKPGIDVVDPEISDLAAAAGLIEADTSFITLLRIQTLTPAWYHELGPDTLPAEAHLDKSAVDFHKGCYLGQEVVSRIESVGHANRTLHAFEVTHGPPPQSGDVFFQSSNREKPAAEITTIARHFGLSKYHGLCYIRRGVHRDDPLTSSDNATQIAIFDPSV